MTGATTKGMTKAAMTSERLEQSNWIRINDYQNKLAYIWKFYLY